MKFFVFLLSMLISTSVLASDEARKVDFTVPLSDDGVPFLDDIRCPPNPETRKRPCDIQMTLGRAAYYALRMGDQVSWDENTHRNELANSIRDANDWPLLSEDKDRIKKMMPKIFSPPLIGAASKILDAK